MLFYTVTRGLTMERARAIFAGGDFGGPKGLSYQASLFLQRTAIISVLFPLFLSGLPAGAMLYWFSSFSMGAVNNIVIDRLLPRTKRRPQVTNVTPHLLWMPLKRPNMPRS
jgi:hypothetical protein